MFCSVFLSVVLLHSTGGAVVDNLKKVCVGEHEEWREGGPMCQPTCDQLGEELCCEVRFVPGCFCVDSHIRDHNGRCVAIDDCPRPGVLTFAKVEVTVLEGAKLASLLVLRVNGSRGQITVRWRVVTPVKGFYSGLSGILNFKDGEVDQSINIQLRDNDARDPDVVLTLELIEPSKKTSIHRDRMKLVIKDDDMRPGYPEMAKVGVSVVESDGVASIQVLRVGGSDGDLEVQWRAVGMTAEVGVDFLNPSSGHLSFAEGETEKIIQVQIVDDEVREAREDFRVELFDPSVGPGVLNFRAKGTRMNTVVHIEDDDMKPGYPEMERKEITVTESKGRVSILVVRRDGVDGEISVRWRVVPGTAVPLLDYRLSGLEEGLLIFPENVTEQRITIRLVDDTVKEEKEVFQVELFDPKPGPGVIKFRARGSVMTTDVIIIDDDMTPGVLELERSRYVVSEGVQALRIWVVRVGGDDGEVSVHWRTSVDGSVSNNKRADPVRDFEAEEGELVFKGGEKRKSLLVHIVDDTTREPQESFVVELFNPQPGPSTTNFKGLGEVKKTTITIQDDDMRPGLLQLESSTIAVSESAGSVQLPVVRTGGSDGVVRVHWEAPARPGSDFFFPDRGELVFNDGETKKEIVVKVVDDRVRNRGDRRFEVRLFEPKAGLDVINFKGLGEKTKVVITVEDDDMNPGRLVLDEPGYELEDGKMPQVRIVVLRVDGTDGQIRTRWKTRFAENEIIFEEGERRKELVLKLETIRSDFEFELLDVRTDLGVLNFRGLGERTKMLIRLSVNPGVLEVESPSYFVSEGDKVVRVGVVRLNGSEGTVRVRWRTMGLTATAGSDFLPSEGELVFENGVKLLFISIPIVDDKLRENNEKFSVELIGAATNGPGLINFRGLAERRRTIVTINDDDANSGFLELEFPKISVVEGAGIVKVGVVRLNGSDGRVSARWRTVALTAAEGSDFVPSQGELVFEDGAQLLFISITIVDDQVREDNETFAVELLEATTDGVFREMKTFVTINDDDSHAGTFGFRDTHVTVGERKGSVTLAVVREGGVDGPVELHWRTLDGTAREGLDFLSGGRGELKFKDGDQEQRFSIQILNREGREGERAFSVGLFDPSEGAVLGKDSLVTIVIQDEEEAVRVFFRMSTIQVRRGTSEVSLMVERSGGDITRSMRVSFETVDGTARGDVDYRRTRGPVTFQANEVALRIRVPLLEGPRQLMPIFFVVRINNPSEGQVVPGRDLLVVMITDLEGLPQALEDRKEMIIDQGTSEQRQLEFRGIPPPPPPPTKETVVTCPAGMTLQSCAPSCQGTCPGLEPVCGSIVGSCIKGCFCPPGMLLDHSLIRCVTRAQCPPTSGSRSPAGNFGGRISTGFQVEVERQQETRGNVEVRGGQHKEACPQGMTFNECAPACQRTCPGLEPVCHHSTGGCVKGCFCPSGMVLDNSLQRCIHPTGCVARGPSERNAGGLLGGLLG